MVFQVRFWERGKVAMGSCSLLPSQVVIQRVASTCHGGLYCKKRKVAAALSMERINLRSERAELFPLKRRCQLSGSKNLKHFVCTFASKS